jgi:hypothetical protein
MLRPFNLRSTSLIAIANSLSILIFLFSIGIFVDGLRRACIRIDYAGHENVSALAKLAMSYHATFIAGDYWTVWPAVFAVNQIRREGRKSAPLVIGLANRSSALKREIEKRFMREAQTILICAGSIDDCYQDLCNSRAGHLPEYAFLLAQGVLPNDNLNYYVISIQRRNSSNYGLSIKAPRP